MPPDTRHTPPLPIPDLTNVRPRNVPISTLIVEGNMQPRTRLDRDNVNRLKAALRTNAKSLPPIIVARLIDAPPWPEPLYVVDGFHRVAAAGQMDLPRIAAKIVEVDRATAEYMAVTLNAAHGLPLSPRMAPARFRRFVESNQHVKADGSLKSYREITADLGNIMGKSTVYRRMLAMYPAIAAEMAGREEDVGGDNPPEPDPWPEEEARLEELSWDIIKVARTLWAQEVRTLSHHAKTEGWDRQEVERRATDRTRKVLRLTAFRVVDLVAQHLEVLPRVLAEEHADWIERFGDSLNENPRSNDF
ncbi:MAG: hypothetical protein JWO26_1904 [Rhodospirillales bacterium]|nr:hypothetical protein [Rhodospirillales bacterium]